MDEVDRWSVAEGTLNRTTAIVRVRRGRPSHHGEMPTRLQVFWKMTEAEEDGMPSEAESFRLERFEDRICSAIDHDGQSILMLALTSNGQREFVFYTKDPEEFLARLTAMPQEKERYPVRIQAHSDPEWSFWQGLRNQTAGADRRD